MNIYNLNTQQNIQQYLHHQMDKAELTEFEKTLANNKDLKDLVDFDQQLLSTMKQQEYLEVKNIVKGIAVTTTIQTDFSDLEELNIIKKNLTKKSFWSNSAGFYLMSSIIICTFLGLGIYQFILPTQQLSKLSSTYLTPYENVVNVGKDSESVLKEGMAAYDKADYQKAAQLLGESRYKKNNKGILLYLGISHLYQNDIESAILVLEELSLSESKHYITLAKWYLALAYLENEKVEKARYLLLEIQSNSLRGIPVADLLAELQELG